MTSFRPIRARPEHVVGRDDATVRQRHALAALERATLTAVGNAEPIGGIDVEAPRARRLDDRVAQRRHAVIDGERLDRVTVALQPLPRVELDRRDLVRQPTEDPPQRAEQLVEPFRSVDRQRHLAAAQCERLEHARKAEVVVGVVVREEDLLELDEADVAAQKLPLRALRAVEQEPVAAAPHQRRAERPLRRRHGA